MKTFFHLSKTPWVFGKIQAAKASGAKMARTGISADRNTNAISPPTTPITPGTIAMSTNINIVPIPKTDAATTPPASVAAVVVVAPKIRVKRLPQPTFLTSTVLIGSVIIAKSVLPRMFAISTMTWMTK